ncbi:MAG: AMP-binding protein [Candidatus Geothermincolia bacterium]
MNATAKLARARTLTISCLGEELLRLYGNAPVLLSAPGGEAELTYGQLVITGNRLANLLISELDLVKGQRVVIETSEPGVLLPLMLGAIKAGALAVPLGAGTDGAARESIAETLRPHVVISSGAWPGSKGRKLPPEELLERLPESTDFFIPYTLKPVDTVAIWPPASAGGFLMSSNANLVERQRWLAVLLRLAFRGAPDVAVGLAPTSPGGLAAWVTMLAAGLRERPSAEAAPGGVLVAEPQRLEECPGAPGAAAVIAWGGLLSREAATAVTSAGAWLLECPGTPECPPPALLAVSRPGAEAGAEVMARTASPRRLQVRDGEVLLRGPAKTPGYWMDMERTAALLDSDSLPLGLRGRCTPVGIRLTRP